MNFFLHKTNVYKNNEAQNLRKKRKFKNNNGKQKPPKKFLDERTNLTDNEAEGHKKRKKLKRRQPHEIQKPISE